MNILIACESSGVVRNAFREKGHEAWSCDLKPSEDNSPFHYQGDVFDFLKRAPKLDLVIAHPPCTYLCNSGARWLYKGGKKELDITGQYNFDENRWLDMVEGASFFNNLKKAAIENNPDVKLAFENPIPHRYAISLIGQPAQYVQPWHFGDPAFKATGLWLRRLKPLARMNELVPPKRGTKEYKEWSVIHRAAPGPTRAEDRSRTFPGLAKAMAEQWG